MNTPAVATAAGRRRPGSAAILLVLLVAVTVPAPALAVTPTDAASGSDESSSTSWGVHQARSAPDDVSSSSADTSSSSAVAPREAVASDVTARSATATGTAAVADLAPPASSWVFRGAGWGHSLGMSQYGAMEMAKDGWSAARILGHYYSGTTYDAVTDTQVVRVNVVHAASSVAATPSALSSGGGAFTVTVPSSTQPVMSGGLGDTVTFTRDPTRGVAAACPGCSGATRLTGSTATIRWDTAASANRTAMTVGGTRYRDGHTVVSLTASNTTTLEVVNHVRLHDEYLDYLREMPWSWPAEALKAQAAAARGYALRRYQSGIRSTCACHVYDTSSDQVYGGYPSSGDLPYWDRWRSAVRATGSSSTGYVVRSGGSVIQAFYSASHGGRSENNEDVWGGTPLSYIRGVADPWSLRSSNPRASWKLSRTGSTVARAFGLPDIARLDLRERTANGGVRWAAATSSSGSTARITGEALRTRAGVHSIALRHLTRRYAGPDRYAVGAAVAAGVAPSASAVVIAAGDSSLVDAAVSGPLAGTLGAPLLLSRKDSLPAPTVGELNRRGSAVHTAYVIGGPGVVSGAVVAQLRERGLTVVRVAGADRYGTAEAVAGQVAARRTVTGVVVAGGSGLADALGASGAATATKEPIVLTPAAGLAEATRRALTMTGATHARVVGGPSAVGAAVVTELTSRGLSVTRLAGSDRYGSSRAVAGFYRSRVPVTSEVVLASGSDANLVDSLVAGTRGRLLVLTPPDRLVEDAAFTLQTTPLLETVTAVGGPSALSSSVLTAAARS